VIRIRALDKKYYPGNSSEPVPAISQVNIDVAEGEFFVLLGPSGSGKTTTLRSIAGLEIPDSGSIAIGDVLVFSPQDRILLRPEARPIGMVFQSYALWPHMTVWENVVFPLKAGIRRVDPEERKRRARKALDLLRLQDYADRSVSALSGGQQQRVALARAIALEPAVLLMDEPLSNLDARLRASLRVELKELTDELGMTVVYVTHDQHEAFMMADKVAVMSHGKVLQQGTVQEIYDHPSDPFVARFVGEMNFLHGVVQRAGDPTIEIATSCGNVRAHTAERFGVGQSVIVGFRPEDMRTTGGADDNSFASSVVSSAYLGSEYVYKLACERGALSMRLGKDERLVRDDHVRFFVRRDRCLVFPDTH